MYVSLLLLAAACTLDCRRLWVRVCLSGTYFLPGPVGVAFFNDPCTMVVLIGVGTEGSGGRQTLVKDVDGFCKVALPAARSDSGLLFLFSGWVAGGKIAYRLIWSRVLWDWGMYFPLRSISDWNNIGDEESDGGGIG